MDITMTLVCFTWISSLQRNHNFNRYVNTVNLELNWFPSIDRDYRLHVGTFVSAPETREMSSEYN